jgi:hypothetical protein
LTPEESAEYHRKEDEERERARQDTGVIGKKKVGDVMLNVIGPRGRPNGGPVKQVKQRTLRHWPRVVMHHKLLYPRTPFEITLDDIGAWKREWEDEDVCRYCDETGTIQKDNPHHFHYWARRKGDTCARCSGHGRVLLAHEERVNIPKSWIRRSTLRFVDADGVVHLVTKKDQERPTRCRTFKGIPEEFLTAFGETTCMMCIVWQP